MILLDLTHSRDLTEEVCFGQSLTPGCSWTKPGPFSRFILRLVGLLVLLSGMSYGQCVVIRDQAGGLVTICYGYAPKEGLLINRPDQNQTLRTTVYRGSPYLSFPIYEDGVLEFAANQQTIRGKIAFNLVTNQVLCQFEGDSVEHVILPDAFRVGARRFVRKMSPKGERVYYMILYAGKSRVLAQLTNNLRLNNRESYQLEEGFDGSYSRQERYFIEFNDKAPQEVNLSKKTVLKVLHTASDQLLASATKNKLTVLELIDAVARYDGFP